MGKKQHQKDKLYLTANEWSTFYGGKKKDDKSGCAFKKLPFSCCSLSLQPFDTPLATAEGVVFDLLHVVPYINKHGRNPATGQPISVKDLIKLNYHKNSNGEYHCPVTFKVFNENSHIVAVRTTGNVYSFEAIDRLNLKTRNMKDLISDENFSRSDLLTLQDPAHPEKWDISTFYHVKNKSASGGGGATVASTVRQMNPETKATMEALAKQLSNDSMKNPLVPPDKKSANDNSNQDASHKVPSQKAHYSLGQVSTGFTSTVMLPKTTNEAAVIDHTTLLYQMVCKKGYVRLHTSLGEVNLELHCDLVPTTCHNFILLCKRGYYNQTTFHRSIRNFMIQGGDPSGAGKGGQSVWKKPFKDEFKSNLTHTGRGVLSMANSGPNTNKSQLNVGKGRTLQDCEDLGGGKGGQDSLFITYRSCGHLDGKHTVFGRVVGGLEVLAEMEKIPTDSNDKPMESIVVTKATVFVDPYDEAELKMVEESKVLHGSSSASDTPDKRKGCVSISTKVGKYISSKSGTGTVKRPLPIESTSTHKKPKHH